jgi:hypothetical protein
MTLAATFLGGAGSRLLPASVPIRFFVAAAFFHLLMWLGLFDAAEEITHFRGGLGPALATVHVLTLGVLVMTAIGASVQLLPMATRRTLAAVWPIKLLFWLMVPGLVALVAGMRTLSIGVTIVGAGVTAAALLLYAMLLAHNLRRAGSIPIAVAYGWTALAALLGVVAAGFALSTDYVVAFVPDHANVALAHLILGAFGFMGMLALGFSHVLIPMFALSLAPAPRPAAAAFAMAVAALIAGIAGALLGERDLLAAAALGGLAAAIAHIVLMRRVLRTGMRKRLGLSLILVRASWGVLPTSLVTGLLALFGLAGPSGPTLFAFLVLGGWLLTFLLGILQRILPFLASMHAGRSARGTPLRVSEIAQSIPLKLHACCHGVALMGLAAAIILDNGGLARSASAVGCIGAFAFAWFTIDVVRKVFPPSISRRNLTPKPQIEPRAGRPSEYFAAADVALQGGDPP